MNEILKNVLDSNSELSLFRYIDGLGFFQWNLAHSTKNDRTKEQQKEIENLQKLIFEACLHTVKYGTVFQENKPFKEYWDWYEKWKKYIDDLSDDDYDILISYESKQDFESIKKVFEK